MLVTEAFANVDGMRDRLVSVGRYALRGVVQPQEISRWIPSKPVSRLGRRARGHPAAPSGTRLLDLQLAQSSGHWNRYRAEALAETGAGNLSGLDWLWTPRGP